MLNIVLHEPEIPFNTGAIGRTCVATGTRLHMIEPFGFVLSDKYIKRAGMDYWKDLDLAKYIDYEDFLKKNPGIRFGARALPEEDKGPRLWFATTKAHQTYADVSFGPDDFIMFGKESAGIPEEILSHHEESCIRIPMAGDTRSLNLSNSASIILYEALRQNDFCGLNRKGELHRLSWETDSGDRQE